MTKKNERNAGAPPKYNVPSKKITRTLPVVVIENLPKLCEPYLRKKNE